jgi:hypothetical protein
MTHESDLQSLSEIADAELGVAEEFSWVVGILSGLAAHLKWDSWLIDLSVAIGAYVIGVYRYRRRAAKAEEAYFQTAGLGKYAGRRGKNDA